MIPYLLPNPKLWIKYQSKLRSQSLCSSRSDNLNLNLWSGQWKTIRLSFPRRHTIKEKFNLWKAMIVYGLKGHGAKTKIMFFGITFILKNIDIIVNVCTCACFVTFAFISVVTF